MRVSEGRNYLGTASFNKGMRAIAAAADELAAHAGHGTTVAECISRVDLLPE
jgi:hypothetical protein